MRPRCATRSRWTRSRPRRTSTSCCTAKASQPLRGTAAVLVAAGSGERLGRSEPKAFVELAGRRMLDWSLAALEAAGIGDVVCVTPAGYEGVDGGACRSASVRNGVAALGDCDAVVVHDAARPLVPSGLFGRCVQALAGWDGVVAAAPVVDTIRSADGGTLDRSKLWAVQTPQVFRREWLERALDVGDDVLAAATDDASLVEAAGGRVGIVEAPASNFKVTTPHDLAVAEWLLSQRC